MKSISIIIPTHNAEKFLERQLESLLAQTIVPEIIVIDSESSDATREIAGRYDQHIRFLQIPARNFDHGGTRDLALRQSTGEFVLFLSQDAIPMSTRYVETILSPFTEEKVGGVFGRQVANPDAPEFEKLIRERRYPEKGYSWNADMISSYGVNAFFFSDTSSAFRRSAYEAVGGFDQPILTNEDMMISAKLLHSGYTLVYKPEASVWHSHTSTLTADYRRYVRIGMVMKQYEGRLKDVAVRSQGFDLTGYVSRALLRRGKVLECLVFLTHITVRFLGFWRGKCLGMRNSG